MKKDEDFWKEINADKIARYKLWSKFLDIIKYNLTEIMIFSFIFLIIIIPSTLFFIEKMWSCNG